ncbi:putative MFS general substrate transporter [Lyophyllum shimeji]|uniref:MFS general substrate transporter n=1 Tax=Lyophyllum shimeji TaxID=47721 RepID=A0A9P3PPX0_LYOSH|nr:putative MFS general substrate transporter [Lyophyllum shimeji]
MAEKVEIQQVPASEVPFTDLNVVKKVQGPPAAASPSAAEIGQQPTELGEDADYDVYTKFDDMHRGKVTLILFSLGMASFLYAIEQTIVSTSVSSIGSALHATGSLTWITTSYLLTTTVLQPITGRLADAVGAKRLLIIEIWVFIFGNIVAGLSRNLSQLVAGRLISGVGGAGILSLCIIMVSHLTNERQRGSYLNLINLVFTVADAMGPIVGGGFARSGNWRWIFLFNAPFGPVITLILLKALQTSARPRSASSQKSSTRAKLATLDFAGMTTLISTLTFLVVALNLGGQSMPWNSATVISMFCAAAASFVAFIVVENYARKPIAPMRLFVQWRWRNVPLAIVVRCLLFFHLFATTFYLPLYLQVLGVSPINAGALVIPFLSTAAITSTITNYIVSRTAQVRLPFLGSLAVLPVGMTFPPGLMSTLDETSTIGRVVGFSLVCGFGFGCGTQISMVIAQVGIPTNELSTVTALVGASPSLGGVLGVGIIGAIINNTFRKSFLRTVGSAEAAGLNLNDVVALVEHTPAGVSREAVIEAYIRAWRTGCRVLAGIAVAQFLLALLLRPVELDKRQGEEIED